MIHIGREQRKKTKMNNILSDDRNKQLKSFTSIDSINDTSWQFNTSQSFFTYTIHIRIPISRGREKIEFICQHNQNRLFFTTFYCVF